MKVDMSVYIIDTKIMESSHEKFWRDTNQISINYKTLLISQKSVQ